MVQTNQLETSRIRGPAGDGYVCRGVWQSRRNKHLFVTDEVVNDTDLAEAVAVFETIGRVISFSKIAAW